MTDPSDEINVKNLICYEDEFLIAVNKPHGLLSIPDGYQKTLPNLVDMMKAAFPSIYALHRLDKETSGVILFARDAQTHRLMNLAFSERTVEKHYLAICCGAPDWDEITLDGALEVDADRRHRTLVTSRCKPAKTSVRLQKRSVYNGLLEIHPHTGYTHQIRAHLAHAGHSILGDSLYQSIATARSPQLAQSYNFDQQGIDRLYLHASSLTFEHPVSRVQLTISATLPRQFQKKIYVLFQK